MNDSYHTDLCLLYPPYLTALACLYLSALLADTKTGTTPLPSLAAANMPSGTAATGTLSGMAPLASSAAVTGAGAASASATATATLAASSEGAAAPTLSNLAALASSNMSADSPAVSQLRGWYAGLHVDLDEVRSGLRGGGGKVRRDADADAQLSLRWARQDVLARGPAPPESPCARARDMGRRSLS